MFNNWGTMKMYMYYMFLRRTVSFSKVSLCLQFSGSWAPLPCQSGGFVQYVCLHFCVFVLIECKIYLSVCRMMVHCVCWAYTVRAPAATVALVPVWPAALPSLKRLRSALPRWVLTSNAVQYCTAQLNSVQFNSTELITVQFSSVHTQSIQINWKAKKSKLCKAKLQ